MTELSALFVLGPPLILTLFLSFFIRSRPYSKICKTLIMVAWINAFAVTLLLLTATSPTSWTGSSQGVDDGVLAAQFGLAVFQAGAHVLEQLLLWGFVAFFAVIIGTIYLFITCLRKGGSLVENMNSVTFKGASENPLVSKFDVLGMQSYLIIGLVTMPSMVSITIGMSVAGASIFAFNAAYYFLLFYRFSLLAYTRIAGKTGLHLGKEDIGKRYERRMLGWFTIANLMLAVVLVTITLLTVQNALGLFADGFKVDVTDILVAVLMLPFVEGFAAVFFVRFWRFWARLGTRLRGMNLRSALYSLGRGMLVGGACFVLFYSILSFMTAATTFFSVFTSAQPPVFNNEVGSQLIYDYSGAWASNSTYSFLLLPVLWSLVCLFLFQFIKVLIGGSLTHRKGVAPEYTIIVASVTMAILIWVLIPATNFYLYPYPVSLDNGTGLSTLSLLHIPFKLVSENVSIMGIYAPTDILYILFLDIPIWIFGSLLLMYFFKFRRDLTPPKKEAGVFQPGDFFKLFTSFCVVVVASIVTLVAINPATPLGDFVHGLLSRLWFPNYTTQAIFATIGSSWLFFHNMIRFLLTVFAPLLLWVSVVGLWKYWKDKDREFNIWYVLAIVLLVVEGLILVDRFTYIAIVVIPLVLAALYRGFYRIMKGAPPKTMFRTTFLKISFYSLILSEIYSTALAIADRYMFALPSATESFYQGGNLGLLSYLLILIPHGLIEIPAAMLAAMIGLYVARRMTAKIDEDEKNLDKFLAEGKAIITSKRVWYPILFVAIFFAIGAAIEIYVTWKYIEPLVNAFGFA